MRLIDADALIKKLAETGSKLAFNDRAVFLVVSMLIANPSEIPTVDAEPVHHAKWLVNEKMRWIICSACLSHIPVVAGWCMDAHINYCPNCGARMDGERKDK